MEREREIKMEREIKRKEREVKREGMGVKRDRKGDKERFKEKGKGK